MASPSNIWVLASWIFRFVFPYCRKYCREGNRIPRAMWGPPPSGAVGHGALRHLAPRTAPVKRRGGERVGTCLSFLGLAVVLSLITGLASLAASSASDALDFFPNVGIVIPDCAHRCIVMQWSGVVGVNKQSSAILSHVITPCHHHAIV